MDERWLVSKLKAGDLGAFEELLLRYEKQIFAHLYGLTANSADAEDLTQETFLRLYDKSHLIDGEKGVKNWLYAVATNVTYDLFRKRKRAGELIVGDEEELETMAGPAAYHNTEAVKDVEAAMERLRPAYRSALTLFYKEGYSYEEIVGFLGMPLNTVKTCIRRGKEELKKYLKDYGQD